MPCIGRDRRSVDPSEQTVPTRERPRPPSYDESTRVQANVNLPTAEPLSLIIDGTDVYLTTPPSHVLYELTRPVVTNGTGRTIGVLQTKHKLVTRNHENPAISHRQTHIYDFSRPHPRLHHTAWIDARRKIPHQHTEITRGLGLGGAKWTLRARGGLSGETLYTAQHKVGCHKPKSSHNTRGPRSSAAPDCQHLGHRDIQKTWRHGVGGCSG